VSALLSSAPIAWIAGWIAGGASVGALLGWWKNRWIYGLVLGALLGPIGWAITAASAGNFRECPACSRLIRPQAKVCPKCGADLDRLQARSSRSQVKGSGRGW
jgi:hypothetical protein